jgi:hypothetical protein
MHDGIISKTLKRQLPILRHHPPIKSIMQKQIGQQRADDSPNANDNLRSALMQYRWSQAPAIRSTLVRIVESGSNDAA